MEPEMIEPTLIKPKRQYRQFSVQGFLVKIIEGFKLLWSESIYLSWQRVFDRENLRTLNNKRVVPLDDDERNVHHDLDEDSGVAYGYSQLAKLFAANFMWIPATVLDVLPGQYVSGTFAKVNYVFVVTSGAYFMFITQYFLSQLFDVSYRDLNEVFPEIWTLGAVLAIHCIGVHGSCSVMWVLRQRDYLHEFILNYCSKFRIDKKYQQTQASKIYAMTLATTIFTEPLFVSLLVYHSMSQEAGFMADLPLVSFYLIKITAFNIFSYGVFTVYIAMNVIPVMTSFLIVIVSKHIKTVLHKQLGRRKPAPAKVGAHNPELLARIHKYERKLIDDYGCDTLTMDWPVIDEPKAKRPSLPVPRIVRDAAGTTGSRASSIQAEVNITVSPASSTSQQTVEIVREPEQPDPIEQSLSRPIVASGLIFSYKNLVKLLSETKRLIRSYERKFGGFHLIQIYLMGIVCAHWIVSGLAETRVWLGDHNMLTETKERPWTTKSTLIVSRAFISMSLFVLTNIVTFVRADRLPQQLVKLRSQLFKINLELAQVAIDTQRRELSRTGRIDKRRYSIFEPAAGSVAESQSTDWQELDQVWSLYDQIVRMTHRVNFRLGNNLYYNKNSLFKLIGREISLILFYVQLIHIYSNTIS